MFVRQRGDRWQSRVDIKGYPEQIKSFDTEAEAYASGAEVENSIRAGGSAEPHQTTMRGALLRYEEEISRTKKGAAQEAYVIKKIIAHKIAAIPLAKVRGADIAAYRDSMKLMGSAPATISRHLAIVGNLFNVARREWGIEVANPVEAVKKPIIRNARHRRLNAGELEKIIAATDSAELGKH